MTISIVEVLKKLTHHNVHVDIKIYDEITQFLSSEIIFKLVIVVS